VSNYNPAALAEGTVFQTRYQIVRCIKAGGMGAVYECVHLATQKRRALKVMLPQVVSGDGMRDRFELEARITASIESDLIVETFDAGVDPDTGAPFLVMELLRGTDLDALLEAQGPFAPDETVALLAQVALALDRTHAAGIVHRDLKPQNLFLTMRDDGSARVKVLDFGIAKVVADGSKTAEQTAAIGTPLYMAPEQVMGDGKIGPPADLYALGHLAYTLLVGAPYWAEERKNLTTVAFMLHTMSGPPEPATTRAARRGVHLPAGFDAWFLRAVTRAPLDRFDCASTQIAYLAAALGTAPARDLLVPPPSLVRRLSATGADTSRPRAPSTPWGPGHPSYPSPPVPQSVPAPQAVLSATPPPSAASALPPRGVAGSPTGSLGALTPTGTHPPTPARGWIVALAAVIVAGLVGTFAVARMTARPPGSAPATSTPAAPASADLRPPPQETAALTAPASTGVAPALTMGGDPPSPPPRASAPTKSGDTPNSPEGATSAGSAPSASAGPAKAKAAAVPKARPRCDPPYFYDAKGNRVFKEECL
jgi:serine/threonine-protein kinase